MLQAPALSGVAPSRPRVSCRACFLIDDGGRVLFRSNASRELANASTTKMVTAVLVSRAGAVGDTSTVSAQAAATGQGGVDLEAGAAYSIRDLLYALLLTSSNDAAVALAEHVAGSEEAFVDRMNRLAGDLGLRHTEFVTSHGLDRPGHYSSARDLARIAALLLSDPDLAKIVATPSVRVATESGPSKIDNTNALLETYRGAVGVKTGSSGDAGEVLVAAAVRGDRRLIAVAMGSPDAAADAAKLLDYGFARLRRTVLVGVGTVVGRLARAFVELVGAGHHGAGLLK